KAKEGVSEGPNLVEKGSSQTLFSAQITERSFRHRQLLMITRSSLVFPKQWKRSELNDLIERPQLENEYSDIDSHLFPYTEVSQRNDLNRIFIYMATKLFGKHAFPMPELCYFLCTLKNNYYKTEYHNYCHAVSHAQSMYWILRKNPGYFTELEMKALMIASIAHDTGHPGVNEQYLKKVNCTLGRMYHTPIVENHHIEICFLILQDINCNVFCDLDGDDYKKVLAELKHAILSTNLNRYKNQCENLRHFIGSDLDMQREDVRDAVKSVLMMTCDLCANWKPWPVHKNAVWSLYKEFFKQVKKIVPV
ncbi:cAMP and cAMP-inhibited cGMP 3',5'-cyclic phosphodiesterase 10A-like, partial [Stegodyphus dumicola]|uniref:cAMP and cAMP-inhibited cGMP 3',5'-cyclic phosphodiesterase 10A-like n=1 Tax=Stegodyphus dumicola TaxID=202533 RepID=UPI0015AE1553